MNRISVALLGLTMLLVGLSSAAAPAFALGACGANYHRNAWGNCVWGGQNQNWCLRHRGHVAAYGANGTRWCY